MATLGLTPAGFVIATTDDVRTSINSDIANINGVSVDFQFGILARFIGIIAERFGLLWAVLEAIYNSQNPDTASGFSLDGLCLLTGTERIEAVFSTVTLTLTGNPAQVVPAGQQISTKSNNGVNKFLTAAPGTIVVLPSWVGGTVYAFGARVTNNTKCYQAIVAGTAAASGGPSTGTTGVTSTIAEGPNTLVWLYLGDGTGAVDVAGQSVLKGTIVGAARDIIQIDQPVGGWSGVINVLDAKVGFGDQSDEALRLTREEELSQPGTSTPDAIRARLLNVPGSTSATVFYNDTDTVDVNGVTAHTVMALVRGGTDADVAAALFAQVAAGIQTQGTTTVAVVDSQGVAHNINFSRPAEINIGVAVTLLFDALSYPIDGDGQVRAAIALAGNTPKGLALQCGVNARASAIAALCFSVAGVLEVTVCNISSVAAPSTPPTPTTNTAIAISLLQLAVYDTSFVAVISSADTP